MELKENMIEFITGVKTATITLSNQKYINRIKKLYSSTPNEFEFYKENLDGSICARIPIKWIKISPPRKVSEEQKQILSERMKQLHKDTN